jgi:hypothetical protein
MPGRYEDVTKVDFTITVPSQMIKSSGGECAAGAAPPLQVAPTPQGIRLLFIDNLLILLISLVVVQLLAVTFGVTGRTSGRTVSLPVVVAVVDGERYLVSMLGENVRWLQNVRAAGGRAVLRSGGREEVQLEEVPRDARAPILRAYLQRAPGARPHVPVNKDAPLVEFEKVASDFPVFRVASPKEV